MVVVLHGSQYRKDSEVWSIKGMIKRGKGFTITTLEHMPRFRIGNNCSVLKMKNSL
jgi:hypothetical protein